MNMRGLLWSGITVEDDKRGDWHISWYHKDGNIKAVASKIMWYFIHG